MSNSADYIKFKIDFLTNIDYDVCDNLKDVYLKKLMETYFKNKEKYLDNNY